MHHPMIFVATSSLLASFLVACSAPGTAPKTVTVTQEDDNRSVKLQVGDILEVTLDANPTTGYQWEVTQVDTSVLKETGEPVYATSEAGLGSGVKVTLRFEAAADGETTLNLAYHRPFETDTPPAKTFSLSVEVQR